MGFRRPWGRKRWVRLEARLPAAHRLRNSTQIPWNVTRSPLRKRIRTLRARRGRSMRQDLRLNLNSHTHTHIHTFPLCFSPAQQAACLVGRLALESAGWRKGSSERIAPRETTRAVSVGRTGGACSVLWQAGTYTAAPLGVQGCDDVPILERQAKSNESYQERSRVWARNYNNKGDSSRASCANGLILCSRLLHILPLHVFVARPRLPPMLIPSSSAPRLNKDAPMLAKRDPGINYSSSLTHHQPVRSTRWR